jgi:hypothetical protein
MAHKSTDSAYKESATQAIESVAKLLASLQPRTSPTTDNSGAATPAIEAETEDTSAMLTVRPLPPAAMSSGQQRERAPSFSAAPSATEIQERIRSIQKEQGQTSSAAEEPIQAAPPAAEIEERIKSILKEQGQGSDAAKEPIQAGTQPAKLAAPSGETTEKAPAPRPFQSSDSLFSMGDLFKSSDSTGQLLQELLRTRSGGSPPVPLHLPPLGLARGVSFPRFSSGGDFLPSTTSEVSSPRGALLRSDSESLKPQAGGSAGRKASDLDLLANMSSGVFSSMDWIPLEALKSSGDLARPVDGGAFQSDGEHPLAKYLAALSSGQTAATNAALGGSSPSANPTDQQHTVSRRGAIDWNAVMIHELSKVPAPNPESVGSASAPAQQEELPLPSQPHAASAATDASDDHADEEDEGSLVESIGKKKTGKRRRERKNYDPEVKEYVEPRDADVLMGRGGRTNNHPGNKRYLEAKEEMQPSYFEADKDYKTVLSQKLVDKVTGWNGRFLKLDSSADKWYLVPNIVARKKASQSLREINTPDVRLAKRTKYQKH